MTLTDENRSNVGGGWWTCRIATSSTTNRKRTGLGSNPSLCAKFTEFDWLTYKEFSSYLTENTVRVLYNDQPLNDVQGDSHCLLWQSNDSHKYVHRVGRRRNLMYVRTTGAYSYHCALYLWLRREECNKQQSEVYSIQTDKHSTLYGLPNKAPQVQTKR